jgi:hypothetical protein
LGRRRSGERRPWNIVDFPDEHSSSARGLRAAAHIHAEHRQDPFSDFVRAAGVPDAKIDGGTTYSFSALLECFLRKGPWGPTESARARNSRISKIFPIYKKVIREKLPRRSGINSLRHKS